MGKRHCTPADIAKFHVINRLGLSYNDDDLRGASHDVLMEGLLHLILSELIGIRSSLNKEAIRDPLDVHRDWLLNGKPLLDDLLARHVSAVRRARKRTGVEFSCRDTETPFLALERIFKRNRRGFNKSLSEIRQSIKRLGRVKTIDDLLALEGIGKRIVAKFHAQREAGNNVPNT